MVDNKIKVKVIENTAKQPSSIFILLSKCSIDYCLAYF